MHVVTDKTDERVLAIGVMDGYWSNGYPVILSANGNRTAFIIEQVNVHKVGTVDDAVKAEKYCYNPVDGFYENPNYQEPNPYGISDELVAQIKNDAITEIEEAVVNADE